MPGVNHERSRDIRAFLAATDLFCACGYNLRGLGGPNCPECNRPIVLPELDRLRLFLANHDIICPCGYNLRGVTAPTCPECNAVIDVSVASHNYALLLQHLDRTPTACACCGQQLVSSAGDRCPGCGTVYMLIGAAQGDPRPYPVKLPRGDDYILGILLLLSLCGVTVAMMGWRLAGSGGAWWWGVQSLALVPVASVVIWCWGRGRLWAAPGRFRRRIGGAAVVLSILSMAAAALAVAS